MIEGDFALWIWLPLLVISAAMLIFFIRNLIGLGKKNTLFSLTLREEQPIEFTDAGKVLLCVEGPLFTRHFAGLRYEIADAGNSAVQGRKSLLRTGSSGFTRARLELMSFTIPTPGKYSLRILGMQGSEPDDSPYRIVFMRPYFIQVIGSILGTIFSAGGLITSLVFTLLHFLLKDGGV